MNSAALWKQIVERAKVSEFEIPTVPRVQKTPLWFRVSSDGNAVFIRQANDNTPSSMLKMPRRINFRDFDAVHDYYDDWFKGVPGIGHDAAQKSQNTAYIFALIAYARSYQQ